MKTVILAAGFGSRLWPLSTSAKPKQFQKLLNGKSLLQYTYNLLSTSLNTSDIYVLTLSGLQGHVFEDVPGINEDNIILVPERRNTLPHTLWALNKLGIDPNEPILFRSVDQFVKNEAAYITSFNKCVSKFEQNRPDKLVLLCDSNSSYNKGYGYIFVNDLGRLVKFVEKPDLELYKKLFKTYTTYRNPLMYISSKAALRRSLANLATPLKDLCRAVLEADPQTLEQKFKKLPFLDISKSLLEQDKTIQIDQIDYDFIDVGTYSALYELNSKDDNGNVVVGNVVLDNDCSNSLVINTTVQPLAIMGYESLVAVTTDDGSVVAPFSSIDSIGELYKNRILQKHDA